MRVGCIPSALARFAIVSASRLVSKPFVLYYYEHHQLCASHDGGTDLYLLEEEALGHEHKGEARIRVQLVTIHLDRAAQSNIGSIGDGKDLGGLFGLGLWTEYHVVLIKLLAGEWTNERVSTEMRF